MPRLTKTLKLPWVPITAMFSSGIAAVLLLGFSGFSTLLDFQIVNHLFQKLGTRYEASKEIVLVVIDDASLQMMEGQLGRWPWPRSFLSQLVEKSRGASAIGIDILFLERDRQNPKNDEIFAEQIKKHGHVALAGVFVSNLVKDSPQSSHTLERSLIPLSDENQKVQRLLSEFIVPIPVLTQSANRIGHVNYFPSSDSLLRSYPYFVTTEAGLIPSLVSAVLMTEGAHARLQEWLTNQRRLELSAHFRELLFYNHPFTRYSAVDLLENNTKLIPPDWAKGKIVLIGVEAEGLQDLRATPMKGNMSGLSIHATALSNLLQHTWLRAAPFWAATMIGCFMCFIPLLFWEASLRQLLVFWGTILGGFVILGGFMFYGAAWRIPWSQPLAGFITTSIGRLIFSIIQERSLRRKIEELEKMKQMLGNMLIHDLKSPLSSMIMLIESARPAQVQPSKREHRLEMALEQGQHLSNLISALLNIQRMEANKLKLSQEHFSWKDLVEESVTPFKNRKNEAQLSFDILYSDLEMEVFADRNLLSRVLQNLFDNAFTFAQVGTSIRCESSIETGKEACLIFRISNHGPALDSRLQEKIFEIFTRGDQEGRRTQGMGFGLGLAFCKLAVVAHGGTIRCISPLPETAEGFCVEFKIPQYQHREIPDERTR
jgi:signal transduction histidine kinase